MAAAELAGPIRRINTLVGWSLHVCSRCFWELWSSQLFSLTSSIKS